MASSPSRETGQKSAARWKVLARGLVVAWAILGIALGFLAALDAVAGAWLDSRPLLQPNWYGDAFQGKEGPWLDEFTREFEATAYRPMRNRWQPYVYSRNAPFEGKYINIDERGLRRTINAPSAAAASQARKSLYFFGGSTLWGHGVRDEYTIPSIVSRLLSEKGHAVEVTNFAQLAYVNTQEFLTLVAELQHGRAPDLAIFFDGFNDVLSTVTNAEPGLSINEESRRREFKVGSQPADRLAALALRSTALCRLLGGVAQSAGHHDGRC